MNNELKSRIFNIPQNVLDIINHTIVGLNGNHSDGINRAKKLLTDKTVTYGQLKRIVHDLKTIDKVNDKLKFDLCGGDAMDRWSKQYLDGERDLVSNRKDSKQQADDISSMTGERKNTHLKKHKKKSSFLPPTNLIKSNSHKTSVSTLSSMKLFEEVDKIKKLINY